MRNFLNKFDRIYTLDAKVTRLQIGLPNYMKTPFVPLGDEGLNQDLENWDLDSKFYYHFLVQIQMLHFR